MSDVFEYLQWRGDLSFECDGFNEVDNLIFSSLAYSMFDGVVPDGPGQAGVSVRRAADELRALGRLEQKSKLMPRYSELMALAADTERFGGIVVSNYVNILDNAKPEQFSAVVFSIGKNDHFIAFRGTDDNLAGWKEDFLMSFRAVVPAQSQAVTYINAVVPKLRGRITLGGHSKGGNLAVFAAVHTTESIRRRIKAVYNNDGPGFHVSLSGTDGYKRIERRIRTFIPQSSVVGMLLEHGDDYTIVASTEKGFLSHNPLTWVVRGKSFVYEKELSKFSRQTSDALRSWLGALSLEQREQFVEALFDLIRASGAQTLSDLSRERLVFIDTAIKKLRHMDKKTRVLLRETIVTFFSIRQKMLRESIGESLEALVAKRT